MKTAVAAFLLFGVLAPEPATYYVGHQAKHVNILFESEADVETILGTTHEATGKMTVDLEQGTGEVSISIPVKSLRTGIDLRDEHLRSANWLDAEKFPNITFNSRKSAFAPGKKDQVLVTGDFSVHGQKREITIPVAFRAIPADLSKKAGFGEGQWVRFSSDFEIRLSDFGVKIPDGGASKVSDTWKVKLTVYAGTQAPK